MTVSARPRPRTPHRLLLRSGAGLAALVAVGLVGSSAQALTLSADDTKPPTMPTRPTGTTSTTSSSQPSTQVPFSTSFEDGVVPQVGGQALQYQTGDAHTGATSVLVEGSSVSVSGLPVAWYDVSAWVKLPQWQPDSRMAWDYGLGAVVNDEGWTKVSGHAEAVGGVLTLSFGGLCPLTLPDPWGFVLDDVSLVKSPDQYPYPVPMVKCKNPLPSVPEARTYDFGQAADIAAWSPDSRSVKMSLINTEPISQGAWLQADVAVPGHGLRVRGLAPGTYAVSGVIRSNFSMGLTEESRGPWTQVKVPGGNEWTPFTLLAEAGDDGSLDLQVATNCADFFPAVITTFALKTLSVTPVEIFAPLPTPQPCPTRTPTTTTTKPTTSPTTTSPTTTGPTTSTTKPTKTKPTKPTKTKATCMFSYQVTSQWEGGFAGEMTVTPSVDLQGWTMKWRFPGNQKVTQFLAGYGTQKGHTVTVVGNGINPNVDAGQPVSVPFVATGSAQGYPTNIMMNGVRCYGGK